MTVAAARRRIHVTETPRLAAILQRHGVPGEPRTATLVRLVERADTLTPADEDFMVFHTKGPALTNDDVTSALEQEELERFEGLARG